MLKIFVQSVGLLAPGLPGWEAGRPVLAGAAEYLWAPMPRPVPDMLPANERRRACETVRLAFAAGQEAMKASGLSAANVSTVFASSDGDGQVVHQICEALASSGHEVSPTRFHNSVHNAPAGYWHIAAGAHTASTSLCAGEASFAAGLLEAASQAVTEGGAVLLIAYDLPFPPPLHAAHPVENGFAVALLLTAEAAPGALADLRLEMPGRGEPTPPPRALAESFRNNAAAACLPLLAVLARGERQSVRLAYLDGGCLGVECVR